MSFGYSVRMANGAGAETRDEDSNDLGVTIMGPNWNLSPEEFWADNLEMLKDFIDFALKADYGLRIG